MSSFLYFLLFQLRVMWYLAMSVMEGDKTVKRNGFVFIRYSVGQNIFSDFHFKLIKKSSAMSTGALPIYTRGFHVCYDSLVLRMAIATLQTFLGRRTRARFRCHYGKFFNKNEYRPIHVSSWSESTAPNTFSLKRLSL